MVKIPPENCRTTFQILPFDIDYTLSGAAYINCCIYFPFLLLLKKKTIKIKRNQIVFAVYSNKEGKLKRGDFPI